MIEILASREASAFSNAIAILTVIVIIVRLSWPRIAASLSKINAQFRRAQRKTFLKNVMEAKEVAKDKDIILEKITKSSVAHLFWHFIIDRLTNISFFSGYNDGYIEGCKVYSKVCLSPEISVDVLIILNISSLITVSAVFISWIISVRRITKLRNWRVARQQALKNYIQLRGQK